MRTITFFNEVANKWMFDCNIKIVNSRCYLTDIFLGSVDYTDGSYIDIYESCGELVGVVGFEEY